MSLRLFDPVDKLIIRCQSRISTITYMESVKILFYWKDVDIGGKFTVT